MSNINVQPFQFNRFQKSTQTEIINHLNFSIEDLLNKISKVTEDYETCNTEFRKQLKHKIHSNNDEDCSSQSTNYTQRYFELKTTNNQNQSNQSQDINQIYRSSNSNIFHHSLSIIQPPCLSETTNRNTIMTSLNLNKEPKKMKIDSLFNCELIRQVATSRIFQNISNQMDNVSIKNQPIKQDISIFKINDFEIGRCVGSGKFGDVFLCRHRETNTIYALKKVLKATILEYNMINQLSLELKIMYSCNHPNIIKLYTHFADQYHIFLLMEYAEGNTLLEKLKSNEQYISRITGQVINALQYLHASNIIHRDLKPENIMINFDNNVKICDFGWAAICNPNYMKTTFCGTLEYLSPEMRNQKDYSFHIDLWSLGVLVYQLLVGTSPFKNELKHWKRNKNVSIENNWSILYPPGLSGLAQSFIRHLLKQNPLQRADLSFCKNHYYVLKHRCFDVEPLQWGRLFES